METRATRRSALFCLNVITILFATYVKYNITVVIMLILHIIPYRSYPFA